MKINELGISKGNFTSKRYPNALQLWLGDIVMVLEHEGDWMRGYKINWDTCVGIFPSCYVQIKHKPKARIIEESLSVAEEWIDVYFKEYKDISKPIQNKVDPRSELGSIHNLLSYMLDLRRQIVSGLTSDKFKKVENLLADSIDFGNKLWDLHLTVRNEKQRLYLYDEITIIDLYRKFNAKNQDLMDKKSKYSQSKDESDPLPIVLNADKDIKREQRSLYLQMKNNVCKVGDEAEFICSLNMVDYEREAIRQISDNLLLRWDINKLRKNADYLQSLRGLFTDISTNEYNKKLFLIIQVIRVGQMDLKYTDSHTGMKQKSDIFHLGNKKDNPKTSNIRRPYGLCAIQYDPEISTGAADHERSFLVYKVPADDEDMYSFTKKLIFGSSSNIQSTPMKELGNLWLQIKTLQGGYEDLKRTYPGLVGKETGCRIVQRKNFPDIIMPGALRNDFYIYLKTGELDKSVKATRSVQVEMTVRKQIDEILPLSIFLEESYFRSTVYKDKNPKWMELVKLVIPVDFFSKCHLLFTLRHRSSTEAKDKQEKDFGFCWLPLKNKNDLTIQDANYKLIVYRVSDPKKIEYSNYCTLPSVHDDSLDTVAVTTKIDGIQFTRDYIYLSTELCSTKIAQNEKLVGLLKWRSEPNQLKSNLEAIRNQQIKSREIMIFLQDILDALFAIMMDGNLKKYDESILLSLCEIIQLLQNESFRYFRSVLETYLDHFSQTLASTKLLSVMCNVIQRTSANDENRKLILRAMEFLFKFIVRSEQLKQQLDDSNPAEDIHFDSVQIGSSSDALIQNFFKILVSIMGENENVSLIPQGAILSYIPNVIDQISGVYPSSKLCDRVKSFIATIGFNKNDIDRERLVEARIQCMHAIIKTDFFVSNSNVQSKLAECLANQISHLVLGDIKIELTVKFLQDYLVHTCLNDFSLEENTRKLLIPIIGRLQHFLHRIEENRKYIPNLTSSLITILEHLSFEFFERFVIQTKSGLYKNVDVLTDLLNLILALITSEHVFPYQWLQFKLYSARIILTTIKMTSKILFKHFLSSDFQSPIWCQFFKLCVAFVQMDFIQLESYVALKRMKIFKEFGDMRKEISAIIKDMWLNLGRNKSRFIESLAGDFFSVTLIKMKDIRKEIMFLLFDMINFETMNNRHYRFDKFQHEIVSATDKFFNMNLGDQSYVELFVEILSDLCLRHEKLQVQGLDFIRKMNILMKLLLEYRDVINKNKDVDDEMLCIEKILKFYRTEFNRLDLYTEYIYKLYNIHFKSRNYTEAAFTLLEHADRLTWSHDKPLDGHSQQFMSGKYEHCDNERDLKEELYETIIELFERGKMWEEAIKCCKELETEYETNLIDFNRLSTYLEIRARLTKKIIGTSIGRGETQDSLRNNPSYFFVGFFGLGFDDNLSNHMFIYRGSEYERLDDFADRLIARFPKARKMAHTKPPDDQIKFSNDQHLQIFPVKPLANIPKVFHGKPVPRKIVDFYRYNQVNDFTYDRAYQKGEKDKNNEFASMWIERRLYRTNASFPGILRWFEIEATSLLDISPLQNAIDTVENKNHDLTSMINEFRCKTNQDFQSLSMTLAGTIDPAVAGGFANYDRAFFSSSFMESCTSSERVQVNLLKDLMRSQIPILEQLLLVHEDMVVGEHLNMSAFHQNLKNKFHDLKAEIEDKYGKSASHTIIKRQASSLARRESKRSMRALGILSSNISTGSRPHSAMNDECTPDLPSKTYVNSLTLPRKKKLLEKQESKSGSQNGTLKRDRSKRISVNIENFKTVKDTLTKAAQKIQKQISTDDFNKQLKTQSQIELRETATNIRPRRPKSQCRSRPESWTETEKDRLKIFKSTDDIFQSEPPPLPKKDSLVSDDPFTLPNLPPKLPEKPRIRPQKPPLPTKTAAEFYIGD